MKKILFSALVITLVGISCEDENPPTSPPVADKYMNLTVGSTWNYELTDKSGAAPVTKLYTVSSVNKDSTINGKSYHVFSSNSGTGNVYYNISGNDYSTLQSLPAAFGGGSVENIYLKDNVAAAANWLQTYPVLVNGLPLSVNVTNTITAKGLSKVVNNITYNDVIQVTTAISVPGIPAAALVTDIQSFYAPKFGLVQSKNKIDINFSGIVSKTDQEIILKSADLK